MHTLIGLLIYFLTSATPKTTAEGPGLGHHKDYVYKLPSGSVVLVQIQ